MQPLAVDDFCFAPGAESGERVLHLPAVARLRHWQSVRSSRQAPRASPSYQPGNAFSMGSP